MSLDSALLDCPAKGSVAAWGNESERDLELLAHSDALGEPDLDKVTGLIEVVGS